MDAITEKLFPILATPAACLPACTCIPLKCFHRPLSTSSIMENAIWQMAAGQLGEEKCHVATAWHASKFGRAVKVNSRFSVALHVSLFLHLTVRRSTETATRTLWLPSPWTRQTVQSASIARSQGLVKHFCGSSSSNFVLAWLHRSCSMAHRPGDFHNNV